MIALDLFAGHGWGVACQRLGIEEYGVEIMPEARAIRAANGMRTAYADVWDGLLGDAEAPAAALQIASPPCQTFSMAGGGAGRRALDEVVALIDERAYLRPADLHAFGEEHDPRTALVLTPLTMVARGAPTYVVWEQVPPVLPVWERAAAEMRAWGYSVWTGIVNAEQYGVPQTRRRAVLIARVDGKEATPPTPTHSRYYSHDPKRLDPGVLPWVSMADALGWGHGEAMSTGTNSYDIGPGAERDRIKGTPEWRNFSHAYERPTDSPAPTLDAKVGGAWQVHPPGSRVMRSNYGTGGDPAARGERGEDAPAPTVTSKADRNTWRYAGAGATATDTAGQRQRDVIEPAHTMTGKGTATFVGDGAARVTVAEAAALQSYPPDFVWNVMVDTPRGPKPITKTKQFLTIGNAVPPLMAEAILKAAIS